MTVVVLMASSLVTWLLRVGFIVIIPARRLPDGVRRVLNHAAVAALAALLATAIIRDGGGAEFVTSWPVLAATVVAGVVAWRTGRMGVTVLAAVAVLWVLHLIV